jgi:F-type H+-transporting ATPase subunit delta
MQATIRDRLASILKQDVDLSTGIDSAVIGGMKLTIGDKIIDGSVAHKLKELEEHVVVG